MIYFNALERAAELRKTDYPMLAGGEDIRLILVPGLPASVAFPLHDDHWGCWFTDESNQPKLYVTKDVLRQEDAFKQVFIPCPKDSTFLESLAYIIRNAPIDVVAKCIEYRGHGIENVIRGYLVNCVEALTSTLKTE